jgi:hypothetical protein
MMKSLFKVFCVFVGLFNIFTGDIVSGILLIGLGIYI